MITFITSETGRTMVSPKASARNTLLNDTVDTTGTQAGILAKKIQSVFN